MAWRVTCKQCGTSSIVETADSPQLAIGCNCCTQAHDHDESANACEGASRAVLSSVTGEHDLSQQHPGAACSHPSENGTGCVVLTGAGEDCPGGHCGPGVLGCTVCRPLLIEFTGIVPMGLV